MNESLTIAAVRTDKRGNVSEVKLTDGRQISVEEAINLAAGNQLAGFTTGVARDGMPTLRGVADGDPSNNLTNLPRF